MSNYLDLLKHCLLDNIYGSTILGTTQFASPDQVMNGKHWPSRAHTMIGYKRLQNIQDCAEDVIRNKIPGDFIETGVWKGGATIFMRGILKHYGESRKVFVADSFEGLPPPDPRYPADNGDTHHTLQFLSIPLEVVQDNFRRYDLLDENVVFVKGFFEHSLKNAPIDSLAILRLDGDMYSSTIQVLEQLYDKVSVGGYIIVDDFGLPGCRKAIEDFREKRNITDPIMPADYMGVYWKKTIT